MPEGRRFPSAKVGPMLASISPTQLADGRTWISFGNFNVSHSLTLNISFSSLLARCLNLLFLSTDEFHSIIMRALRSYSFFFASI